MRDHVTIEFHSDDDGNGVTITFTPVSDPADDPIELVLDEY